MASIINASTSAGLVQTADTSGILQLQSNGTTIATISSTGLSTQVGSPAFGAYMSTNQSLSSGNTKIAFDTKAFDTASCFNTSTYRFTPNVAGYYQFNVTVASTGTMTGAAAQVWKNGNSGTFVNIQGTQVSGNISYATGASGIMYMNGTTDYVECYQYVAASTTIQSGSNASIFSGALIRSA